MKAGVRERVSERERMRGGVKTKVGRGWVRGKDWGRVREGARGGRGN